MLLRLFAFILIRALTGGRIAVDYSNRYLRYLQKFGLKMLELQAAVRLPQRLFPLLVCRGFPEVFV